MLQVNLNMKMPETCMTCPFRTNNYRYEEICLFTNSVVPAIKRRDNCPLKEVPADEIPYREETCDRKVHCNDYQHWHCIGCNGCKINNMTDEFVEYAKTNFGADVIIKPAKKTSDTFESLFGTIDEGES